MSALKTVGICHNKKQNKTKQKQQDLTQKFFLYIGVFGILSFFLSLYIRRALINLNYHLKSPVPA